MELAGRVAIVTGGSGTLGEAIVRALVEQGVAVAVTYVGERERAEAVAASVVAKGGDAWAVRLDQADPAMPAEVVAAVIDHFGQLDILVNNAAWNTLIPFSDLEAMTPELWDTIYATNLRGPFLLARAAAPALRAAKGRIVNVSSIGGLVPGGSSIAYSTSKAALIHLTKCLAVALAPDVAVNCLCPGLVPGSRMSGRLNQDVVEAVPRMALLGRAATAEDMADQVVQFCRSDSMTAQVVAVDGGQSGRR